MFAYKDMPEEQRNELIMKLKTIIDTMAFYSNTACDDYLKLAKQAKELQRQLYKDDVFVKQLPSTEELIKMFIVNQLGINLCSVKSINIDRQEDNQIKEIKIELIPAKD